MRAFWTQPEEGSGGATAAATGIIGLEIRTDRITSGGAYNLPNGNDAQPEIDIDITPKSDYNKRATIRNFPIATLGLPADNPNNTTGFVYRTGLGTGTYALGIITHNVAPSQIEWLNWSAQELADTTGPLIISYRWHDIVAPYQDATPVTQTEPFSFRFNPGVYGDAPPTQHAIQHEGQIRASGFTSISHGNYEPAKDIRLYGSIRTTTEITLDRTNYHSIEVGGEIRLAAQAEFNRTTQQTITVSGSIRLQLESIQLRDARQIPIRTSAEITAVGESILTVNGADIIGPIDPDEKRGYMPAVAMGLWKRLRL